VREPRRISQNPAFLSDAIREVLDGDVLCWLSSGTTA
jgi:hypothetical protein